MRMMERTEPVEEHKEIELVPSELEKTMRIGSQLNSQMELFVFQIDPEVIVHRLNVDPQAKQVKQKKRSFGSKHNNMMDAYQGYHQIFMAEQDRDKTSFITDNGIYLHNVITFELKNECATYQRLVNRMFKDLIGKTMEVYLNDMLIKNKKEVDHLTHLQAAFEVMRRYGMKFNPAKCTFGVRGETFLGYMVSEKGTEANLEKIKAIMHIGSPKTIKDVQKLTGKVASLARLISSELSISSGGSRTSEPSYYVDPQRGNARADLLSKSEVMLTGIKERKIFVIVKDRASIEENRGGAVCGGRKSWKNEIEEYLLRGIEPNDPIAVHGSEVVIPDEIVEEIVTITQYDAKENRQVRNFEPTTVEEIRDKAFAKILYYKSLMMKSYNSKVKPRNFQIGDLVVKKVEVPKHVGKVDSSWEGPYKVTEVKKRGTYRLQDMEGKDLPRPWNVHNLRMFYA
ncbi:UNVERIFIED_CONTAM: Retrovirus-related Pol polyprotein from transposon gypsy [Sesamum radiatum]|uniref:Retrovirus-related Pol polyprotein from transposon gypsy n=1 Tax=Sesamum radiatum TaxID=300843 RepID=A0AAW2U8B9_SESRA